MIFNNKWCFGSVLFFIAYASVYGQSNDRERYLALESFSKAVFYLENLYVEKKKVESTALLTRAMKGIISGLDDHTVLMPKRAFEQMNADTRGEFGGIGIVVTEKKGQIVIISPIEDSPAYKVGIKAGDVILSIDSFELSKLPNDVAIEKMRGAPGSVMDLKIMRQPGNKIKSFKIVREVIEVKSVKYSSLSDKIGYFRISSFQETTHQEMKKILATKASGKKGIIIDLRNNPGGLLDQAVKISDLFIDSGIIVSTVGRKSSDTQREFATKEGSDLKTKIVVLMNKGSASASEIVAGALQDYKRATILGQTSYGKGSVQTLIPLPDGSGIKLTIALYYTPLKQAIQGNGVKPDIALNQTILKNMSLGGGALSGWPTKMKADLEVLYGYKHLLKKI